MTNRNLPAVGTAEWLAHHDLPVALAVLEENELTIFSQEHGEEDTVLLAVTLAYEDGDTLPTVARAALRNLGFRVGRWTHDRRDADFARADLRLAA